MNVGSIIFGFFMVCCIVVGILFISANSNTITTDTYGFTQSKSSNVTTAMVSNVTATGTTALGLSALVIASLAVIGGVAFVVSKSK